VESARSSRNCPGVLAAASLVEQHDELGVAQPLNLAAMQQRLAVGVADLLGQPLERLAALFARRQAEAGQGDADLGGGDVAVRSPAAASWAMSVGSTPMTANIPTPKFHG
jgi:hypothetical protein